MATGDDPPMHNRRDADDNFDISEDNALAVRLIRKGWCLVKPMKKVVPLGLLLCALSAFAQETSYPLPNAAQQAGIDKDNGRHFGDSPLNPGPLATNLSPELTAQNIDKALKKVADWQLVRSEPFWDQIWTSSVM